MDLYRIIRELVQERDRVQRIIDSLEQVTPGSKVSSRPEGKRRGRKSMDNAAREEVSERMKRYWKQRRAEKQQAEKQAAREASKDTQRDAPSSDSSSSPSAAD